MHTLSLVHMHGFSDKSIESYASGPWCCSPFVLSNEGFCKKNLYNLFAHQSQHCLLHAVMEDSFVCFWFQHQNARDSPAAR